MKSAFVASLAFCLGVSLSTAQATQRPTGQIQVTADGHFLMQADGEPVNDNMSVTSTTLEMGPR